MAIILRATKGSPLTSAEIDANFNELLTVTGSDNSIIQSLTNKTIKNSKVGGGIVFDGYLETGGYTSVDPTLTTLGSGNFSSSSSTKLSISAVNSSLICSLTDAIVWKPLETPKNPRAVISY